MTIRRPPPRTEATAIIERQTFDDDDYDVVAARSLDGAPDERTDPERLLARAAAGAPRGVDDDHSDDLGDDLGDLDGLDEFHVDGSVGPAGHGATTGRYELGSIEDLEDYSLPGAHVSELEVSDLDGDVAAGGAPTAILHRPSLLTNNETAPHDVDEVALRRWSAGPPVRLPVPELQTLNDDRAADDGGMAATLPALSIDTVRAAAAAAGIGVWPTPLPTPLPTPVPGPVTTPAARRLPSTDVSTARTRSVRAAVEGALAAVAAAQATADDAHVAAGLHGHLEQAIEALTRALELADD